MTGRAPLTALPQARQHFQPAVAIRGLQSHFDLIVAHRLHGIVADAAVGAASIKACLGQPNLHFPNFGKRQRALGAREWLDERWPAQNAVTEMADRKRIAHRGVVTTDRVKIWTQQKTRAPRYWRPQFRG